MMTFLMASLCSFQGEPLIISPVPEMVSVPVSASNSQKMVSPQPSAWAGKAKEMRKRQTVKKASKREKRFIFYLAFCRG